MNITTSTLLILLKSNDIYFNVFTGVQISFTETDVRVNEDNGTVFVCLEKDKQTLLDIDLQVTARERNPPDDICEPLCMLIT